MNWTPEELAEMAAADAEIEAEFELTEEEVRASDERDAAALQGSREARDRERNRRYYLSHREERRAKRRAYYHQNKEKISEKYKAKYAETRAKKPKTPPPAPETLNEKRRKQRRERYLKNREKACANQMAYYWANRDQINARKRAKRMEKKLGSIERGKE